MTSEPRGPDLGRAAEALAAAQSVVDSGVAALGAAGGPDVAQVLAYDVAHAAAAAADGASAALGLRGTR